MNTIHLLTFVLCLAAIKCEISVNLNLSKSKSDSTPSTPAGSEQVERPGPGIKDGGYVYRNTRPSELGHEITWDPNGYLFFCLAMGRIGNQIEHFLGSLAFAKQINRTLVLPPLRTYRNVRFTEWFQFEPLLEYHRVILAEDFMEYLAPSYWPEKDRVGYCFRPSTDSNFQCTLKEGYPWKPFWDGLDVDFVRYDWLDYSYQDPERFARRYTGSRYPVLAMRGAPAPFPMLPEHWPLQRYVHFTERIEYEANRYINENFQGQKFVGLHLRNGEDWQNACKHAKGVSRLMASTQCLHETRGTLFQHPNMCFPPKEEILRLTRDVVTFHKANVVFVATDKNPMITEIESHLEDLKVKVFHMDPHLPIIDQAILIKSDHFIGNCVSSFTSFVTRHRLLTDKPTSFWGYD